MTAEQIRELVRCLDLIADYGLFYEDREVEETIEKLKEFIPLLEAEANDKEGT